MGRRRRLSTFRRFAARAFALYALFQAVYPVSLLVLLGVDAIWPHEGVVDAHASMAPYSALLAAVFAGLAWCCDRRVFRWDRHRLGRHGRPDVLAAALAIVGLLLAAQGVISVVGAIWFDLTYVESGHVGASLASAGILFGYALYLPAAACLLAAAATLADRPEPEPDLTLLPE